MATIGGSKIQQILDAGQKQLSPEEFGKLSDLVYELGVYGLTPWINCELGKIMAKLEWELDVGESPEWHEALQQCDYAFLGNELKAMAYEVGASPVGHKKELCARLYKRKVPEVLAVMEPYLKEMTPEQIKEEIERFAKVELLPQTEHPWVSTLRQLKDGLERLYRLAPEEFYLRKKLIGKAIKERQDGLKKTMPEQTLVELRELLDFANRLYR